MCVCMYVCMYGRMYGCVCLCLRTCESYICEVDLLVFDMSRVHIVPMITLTTHIGQLKMADPAQSLHNHLKDRD